MSLEKCHGPESRGLSMTRPQCDATNTTFYQRQKDFLQRLGKLDVIIVRYSYVHIHTYLEYQVQFITLRYYCYNTFQKPVYFTDHKMQEKRN